MDRKRLIIIVGAVIGFIVIVLVMGFLAGRQPNQQQPAPKPSKVVGNFDCLPKKNVQPGQPQTLECAIGLRTPDGKFYALQNLSEEYQAIEFSTEVTVHGDISAPKNDEKYNIEGTINVYSVVSNQ